MAVKFPFEEFPGFSTDPARLPRHVAVVMDGNGRWALQRGLPRLEGHRQGAESVRKVVEGCRQLGIPYLTLFVFSQENWQRPHSEINFLMGLLRRYLMSETRSLAERGIRLLTIGNPERLPSEVRRMVEESVELTAHGREMTLTLALSYGGRQEVVSAVRRIAAAVAAGTCKPEEIDEAMFAQYLDTAGLPEPDLLVRTSGELRISNFLLYQLAYTELYFTEVLWPDFREREFLAALSAYQRRERRFGTIGVGSGLPLRAIN